MTKDDMVDKVRLILYSRVDSLRLKEVDEISEQIVSELREMQREHAKHTMAKALSDIENNILKAL